MSQFLNNLKKQCSQQPLMVVMTVVLTLNGAVMLRSMTTLEKASAAMAVFDGAGLAQMIKEMGISKESLETMKMVWDTSTEVLARTEDVLAATGYGETLSPGIITQFSGAAESGGPIADIMGEAEASQFNFEDMMKLTNVGLSIMQKGGLENVTFADGYGIYDAMFGKYVNSISKRDVAREYSEATTRDAMESNWDMVAELPELANQIANLTSTAQTMAGTSGSLRAQLAIDALNTAMTNKLLLKVLQQNAINENQRIAREQEAAVENGRWSNPDANAGPIEVEGTPWLQEGAGGAGNSGGGWKNPDEQKGASQDWVNPDDVQQALGG